MADYAFGFAANYQINPSTNQYEFQSATSAGTLTDTDSGSDTFDANEQIFIWLGGDPNNPFAVGGYIGSLQVAGQPVPVLDPSAPLNPGELPGGTLTVFFSGTDTSIAPQTFALTDPEFSEGTAFTVCFAAGTLIAMPTGERAVETLVIGDLVSTADGRSVPVKWIGRQTVHKLFTPAERLVPVRVAAGSLGNGLPHTDLVLTADHALILDGLAINAGALVNGTTIAYDPIDSLPERVTYYHVETEDHDVILANGARAETYVDYVQRRVFDNYQAYLDLYGEEKTIREMDLPRVSAARLVPPAIRARLNGEAAA